MIMEIDLIMYFIKFLGLNLGISLCSYKLINTNQKTNVLKIFILILISIFTSIVQASLRDLIPTFVGNVPLIILYSLIFSLLFHTETHKSLSITFISMAITYIFHGISVLIAASIYATICKLYNYITIKYICVMLTSILSILLIHILFKLKRFKNGFSFLKNDYLNILILISAIIVMFCYALGYNYRIYFQNSANYLLFILLSIAIVSFVAIKQSFIIYHKQKIQTQTLKDYEKELEETKQKLKTALEEKEKIIKSNHEFYHRQEALKNKLNMLTSSPFNSEISEEISAINNRINNLSNEYNNKTQILPKLTLTEITEIDDMLSYFQKECYENNIEFIFKLDCNINKIVDNLISKSQLETLLGDLLRNAIIAINHNNNSYKGIMLVFGIKDNYYELDVFDSGIPFEIDTLLNLGLQKCSTHLNEGGTGIGFITTFETLQNTNASIIIEELNLSNYTKSICIRFDNQQQYVINSNRTDLLKAKNINNRDIKFINSNKKTEL